MSAGIKPLSVLQEMLVYDLVNLRETTLFRNTRFETRCLKRTVKGHS